MKSLHALLTFASLFLCACPLTFADEAADAAVPADVKLITDVPYKSGDLSDYEKERCNLDLYLPTEKKAFPTIVWLHGGGLTGGGKKGDAKMARSFAHTGVGFISAEYRLSPNVKYPAYIQDSAAAFAWAHAHIAEYGGNAKKLFIAGHSAGGYLTFMVALDPKYLAEFGLELSSIAGAIPVSGQTMTHFTVRDERGIGKFTITADEAAPVYFGRKETPPMLVLYGDHDMATREEENAYFVSVMKSAGNKRVMGQMIADRTHVTIVTSMANEDDPARIASMEFIKNQIDAAAK